MNQMRQHTKQKSRNETRADGRVRVYVAVEIPARPEVVFDYLSDLENNPEWNWAVTHTIPLDDRTGMGARYRQKRAWPRPGREILEVTVHEPPSLLQVVAVDAEAGPVRYRYRLGPLGNTSTRLDVRVELQPANPTPKNDMFIARVAAAVANNLEDLRDAIIRARFLSAVAGTG